jgi:dihydropteroate synthase
MAVEEYGVDIINDVSEGADTKMFRMVARLGVAYILMSVQPTIKEMLLHFAQEVDELRSLGQKDIILDPGFGFGKTTEQNYEVMSNLENLNMLHLPFLVGVSRKSMIYKVLGGSPSEALNGTTVLNTIALQKGAAILRVHDVREAVECVSIVESLSCRV